MTRGLMYSPGTFTTMDIRDLVPDAPAEARGAVDWTGDGLTVVVELNGKVKSCSTRDEVTEDDLRQCVGRLLEELK